MAHAEGYWTREVLDPQDVGSSKEWTLVSPQVGVGGYRIDPDSRPKGLQANRFSLRFLVDLETLLAVPVGNFWGTQPPNRALLMVWMKLRTTTDPKHTIFAYFL